MNKASPAIGLRNNCRCDEKCVIVFVRAPVKGKVKTRLAKVLAPDVVLDLYRCFVADIFEMLARSGFQSVVCFHPAKAEQKLTRWLGEHYCYLPQKGRDLGARMAHAFDHLFQHGCRQALLIGTDFPDLPPEVIHQAFHALDLNGKVIGPTHDGGYYLIGFERRHFQPAVFDNIPWGTHQVFAETEKRLGGRENPPLILPRWRDIDEFEDLLAFAKRRHHDANAAPHTRALLQSLDLKAFMTPS
jgi:rSAM/selenodomain-associated transferase 1